MNIAIELTSKAMKSSKNANVQVFLFCLHEKAFSGDFCYFLEEMSVTPKEISEDLREGKGDMLPLSMRKFYHLLLNPSIGSLSST